ncbi:unnamed protein product [Anisakis simplex]|uniref:Uncharacterized protein n=1 Tax=Anisakis simplex TaxID=6269 RepID=A0A0M3KBT6_ANISI|nr:unnamed protein product [Anisakis simplex]
MTKKQREGRSDPVGHGIESTNLELMALLPKNMHVLAVEWYHPNPTGLVDDSDAIGVGSENAFGRDHDERVVPPELLLEILEDWVATDWVLVVAVGVEVADNWTVGMGWLLDGTDEDEDGVVLVVFNKPYVGSLDRS